MIEQFNFSINVGRDDKNIGLMTTFNLVNGKEKCVIGKDNEMVDDGCKRIVNFFYWDNTDEPTLVFEMETDERKLYSQEAKVELFDDLTHEKLLIFQAIGKARPSSTKNTVKVCYWVIFKNIAANSNLNNIRDFLLKNTNKDIVIRAKITI